MNIKIAKPILLGMTPKHFYTAQSLCYRLRINRVTMVTYLNKLLLQGFIRARRQRKKTDYGITAKGTKFKNLL